MESTNGSQHFAVELELGKLQKQVEEVKNMLRGVGNTAQNEGDRIDGIVRKLTQAAAGFFTLQAASNFARQVAAVRGEFQQLEVAFKTMLQSKEKADALMSQLVRTAAITPFGLQDVANGAKQLLAYGLASDKVNDTLVRLGDIAAGLSIPLNDLVYLYGTTMTQGRLFTQDLRQFMGRGIPLADELAKQFGVTKDKVGELVTAGKVGFPEVQKAIESLTNEGGKFGGLMEEQSKTITGQISNIEDAIDVMFNEIGQKSEGVINTALSGVSYLIENYEKVGRAVLEVAGIYGTYKAALIALTTAEKLRYQMTLAHMAGLTNMQAVMTVLREKTVALNKAMLANPYVIAAAVVAGLAYGIYKLATAETTAEKAVRKHREEQERLQKTLDERKNRIEGLIRIIQDETETDYAKAKAYDELRTLSPALTKAYKREQLATASLAETNRMLNEERDKADYDNIVANVNKYRNAINEARAAVEKYRKEAEKEPDPERKAGLEAAADRMETSIRIYDRELQQWQEDLDKYNRLKRQAEEDAKPVDVKLLEAKSSREQIVQEYNAAKLVLEQEQEKIKNFPFATIPITVQLRFENAKNALKNVDNTITNLSSQQKTGASYKKAFADAKNAWEKAKKDVENAKSKSVAEYETAISNLKTAKETYEKLGGVTSESALGKQKKASDKKKEAQRKLNDELLSLQLQNQQDETALMEEGTKKRLKQIEDDYNARRDALRKQAREWSEENKEAGATDVNAGGLTQAQQDEMDEAYRLTEEKRKKGIEDVYKEEIQAMRDYLEEYGSLEQQKLAITEEYEEKIRKAQTEGEKLKLRKELEVKLSGFTFGDISKGLDWKSLFSGVESLSKEMLKPMMDQLLAYTKTDEYRGAGSETQQAVAELIQEIRQYLGTDQSVTWQSLAAAMDKFTASVDKYNKAVEMEKAAVARQTTAEGQLARGEITKEEYDKIRKETEEYGEATAAARKEMDGLAVSLNEASEQVKNYVSGLTSALNNATAWKGVDGFSNLKQSVGDIDQLKGTLDSILPTMSDGIGKKIADKLSSTIGDKLSSIGGGLSKALSSGIGSVVGIVAQIPKLILSLADAIKNFVTGILDSITELISFDWLSDLVNSILASVGNLIDAIFDLPENLYKCLESIVVNGVGGLVNTVVGRIGNILSFGALSSGGPADWFTNSNAKEVQDTIDRLTERNKILTTAIEDLTDVMKDSKGGQQFYKANREAIALQQETNDNYKKMAQAQAGYHGSHHSWDYYWDGFSQEEINRLSDQIGRSWNGDIWDLSPEEMKQLRSNVDMWEKIQDTGKGDYGGRLTDKLDDYIDQAGKLEDITEQWKESLTGVSFDSFYDDFVSMLSDMDADSEDFAENFGKYLKKQMISNLIANEYKGKIQKLYEDWFKLSDNEVEDGAIDLSKTEADEIRRRYENLAKEIQDRIKSMNDVYGFEADSERTATAKGIATASQDSVDYMNGILTNIQGHTYSINENVAGIAESMSLGNSRLLDIRNIMESLTAMSGASLNYLAGIESNTARLEAIETALLYMRSDLSDIRLKGVKMQ